MQVHLRYQIERSALAHNACKCDVYLGIVWLKSSEFQQRITRNITEKFTNRLREIFEMIQREILFTTQQEDGCTGQLLQFLLSYDHFFSRKKKKKVLVNKKIVQLDESCK